MVKILEINSEMEQGDVTAGNLALPAFGNGVGVPDPALTHRADGHTEVGAVRERLVVERNRYAVDVFLSISSLTTIFVLMCPPACLLPSL